MTQPDEDALKAEIDEIMDRVDTIMQKVARLVPEENKENDKEE